MIKLPFRRLFTCAFISSFALSACSQKTADIPLKGEASPYLFVFAGDQDLEDPDFLAMMNVDPASETRGEPISSVSIGLKDSMPHHTEYVAPPVGEPIFMNAHHSELSLIVDTESPGALTIEKAFKPPASLRYPHDYKRTPNGTRLVGFLRSDGPSPDPSEDLNPGGHGGIAEYTVDGEFIRSVSAAVPGLEKAVRPYAFALLPEQDRFLVTSAPMHENSWADVVQIYRYSDFTLLHTLELPVGRLPNGEVQEGSQRAGFGPRVLDDGSVFLNAYGCAFYHVTDIDTDAPNVSMVYTLKTKAAKTDDYIRGACGIPLRMGDFWVQPVGHRHEVVVLDISDPTAPEEVFHLKTPRTFNPHWLGKDPLGNRLVLGSELGSEQGFFILRFDEETGALAFDKAFQGKQKGLILSRKHDGYVSFDRPAWPHGETGMAFGHAAVFFGEGNALDYTQNKDWLTGNALDYAQNKDWYQDVIMNSICTIQ